MLSSITFLTDPLQIASLTEKWVAQQHEHSDRFVTTPRTGTLLRALDQEGNRGPITSVHSKLAMLYATIHHGLKRRCDVCSVNPVSHFSLKCSCYCQFCTDYIRAESETSTLKHMGPVYSQVKNTVFGDYVISYLEAEYQKLLSEIPTVSRNAYSELQGMATRTDFLLQELRKKHNSFMGE